MNARQMVEWLKGLGLGRVERSKVMETFHDAGEVEARQQAGEYLDQKIRAIASARQAARDLCGVSI